MDVSVRGRALRQAAKLAFGSAAMGCGGVATAPPDAAMDAKANDVAIMDAFIDASEDAALAPDAGLACTGNPVSIDASINEQTFACCAALVGPEVAEAGSPWDDASTGDSIINADPNLQNCCTALIAYIDVNLNEQWAGGSAACCFALGYENTQIACDPWGPPMPPAMEWVS